MTKEKIPIPKDVDWSAHYFDAWCPYCGKWWSTKHYQGCPDCDEKEI